MLPLGPAARSSGYSEDDTAVRNRVHARAVALALLAGRVPPYVTQHDYEQAKREVLNFPQDMPRPASCVPVATDRENAPSGPGGRQVAGFRSAPLSVRDSSISRFQITAHERR